MKRTLGSVRLKSGEDMTIVHAVAPEGDYGLDIPEFMHVRGPFKEGSAWHRYLVRAWRGELADRVRVSFCVGEIDGEKVGVVGYSAPETTLDVCTWGHVVTRSDQTGKGIATALTAASIEEFRELRDGPRAMFLSTGSDGAPRRVYEKCGFTVYGIVGGGAAMWLPMGEASAFEQDYYGDPGELSHTPLRLEDLPRLEALMSLPHWVVKSRAGGIIGPRAFEGHFHGLWERTASGMPCRMLRGREDRVFGAAWMSEEDGAPVLDVVVHPNAEGAGVGLAEGVVEAFRGWSSRGVARQRGVEVPRQSSGTRAYVAAEGDYLRRRVLTAAGFEHVDGAEERVRVGEEEVALEKWERRL